MDNRGVQLNIDKRGKRIPFLLMGLLVLYRCHYGADCRIGRVFPHSHDRSAGEADRSSVPAGLCRHRDLGVQGAPIEAIRPDEQAADPSSVLRSIADH